MRDKDEWQPVLQLARYARSNLVLHFQGPFLLLPPVLSLPSEERYGTRRGENATVQHSPPVACFVFRPKLTPLHGVNPCCKLYSSRSELVLLFTNLFTVPLACECFLHAFLFAWFQVKGVALDLFDNVFRLHLPLETTKSILQRLAFLNTNFCQD
jgi:hypothetical protein